MDESVSILITCLVFIPLIIIFSKKNEKAQKKIKALLADNKKLYAENIRLRNTLASLSQSRSNISENATIQQANQAVDQPIQPMSPIQGQPIQPQPIQPQQVQLQPIQPQQVQPQQVQPQQVQPQQVQPQQVQPQQVQPQPMNPVQNQPTVTISEPESVYSSSRTVVAPPNPQKEGPSRGTVLFGIGVFFVLLAGVIFATTTWQILSSYGKVITLLAAVVVFYISSFIAKEKLKLRETGITFFLLGSGFLSAINLSIGYFKWFSESYSFEGSTGYLVVGISLIILTVCLIVGRKLYDMRALSIASEILSVADVLAITLFFTDKYNIALLVIGAYLWILYAFLYFYEYRNGTSFLLKALYIISYLYAGTVFGFVIGGDMLWAAIASIVALSMIIPRIYWDESKRDTSIKVFDGCIILYAVTFAIRASFEFEDIRIAAVFVMMAVAFEILFRFVKLPGIGSIKNKASDFGTVFVLILAVIVTINEGTVGYKQDVMLMHMIHVYPLLAAYIAYMVWAILRSREESATERVRLYVCTVLAIGTIGWVQEKYYSIGNLIAFGLIIGFYFLWRLKLKSRDDTRIGNLPAIACVIIGLSTNIVCIYGDKWVEMLIAAVFVALLYYITEKEKKYICCGISICLLYTLIYSFKIFSYSSSLNRTMVAHFFVGFMVVGIIVGRIRYKMLRDTREGHEGIDFIGAGTVIFAAACSGYNEYLGIFAFALYLASFYKRTRNEVWRVLVGIAAISVGHLIYKQPFVELPQTIGREYIVATIFIVLVLEGFIWNKYMKVYSYVSSAILSLVMFSYAMEKREILYYADGGLMKNAIGMIIFFLFITVVVWATGFLLKNEIFNITAGVLLIISSIMTGSINTPIIGIIVLAVGALYGYYLYKEDKEILIVMPLAQMYCFLIMHKPMPQLIWIGVFIISLGIGLSRYAQIYTKTEDKKRIDWFTVLAIIPSIAILCGGNDKWIFCGEMMFALYFLSMYKRFEDEKANRGILSVASGIVALAIITQPFFAVPKEWHTEWILLIIWATVLFNALLVYKNGSQETKSILMFVLAVVSVLWQGVEAIDTGKASDAIILGVCMALLLVYSFYRKKETWFFLAAVTLVIQGIYATREFWASLEWWIYILAVGVLFISVAAKNEYSKRNPSEKEKKKFFADWSVW